jgi:hypothetical protein
MRRRSPVSEDLVLVDEVQSDAIFLLKLDSAIAFLDEESARDLRDRLNVFLGADKQPGTISITFPRGTDEPDLPIGTRLIDNEGDVAERVEDGWKWVKVGGHDVDWNGVYSWDTITSESGHKWFRVVA